VCSLQVGSINDPEEKVARSVAKPLQSAIELRHATARGGFKAIDTDRSHVRVTELLLPARSPLLHAARTLLARGKTEATGPYPYPYPCSDAHHADVCVCWTCMNAVACAVACVASPIPMRGSRRGSRSTRCWWPHRRGTCTRNLTRWWRSLLRSMRIRMDLSILASSHAARGTTDRTHAHCSHNTYTWHHGSHARTLPTQNKHTYTHTCPWHHGSHTHSAYDLTSHTRTQCPQDLPRVLP
jgi:hypothetical protein